MANPSGASFRSFGASAAAVEAIAAKTLDPARLFSVPDSSVSEGVFRSKKCIFLTQRLSESTP